MSGLSIKGPSFFGFSLAEEEQESLVIMSSSERKVCCSGIGLASVGAVKAQGFGSDGGEN